MRNGKKNVLLWKFGEDHTRGLKDHLADDIEIKVWIDKKKFRTSTHYMDDLYKQLRFRKNSNLLKADYRHQKDFIRIQQKIAPHANAFLYMYSRYPALNAEHNFIDMMDAMHVYTDFFLDVLRTNRIDYAFFSRTPHRGPDFILYLVAKELGVKTFILQQSTLPEATDKSFLTTDMHETGKRKAGDGAPVEIKEKHRESPYYMRKTYKTNRYVKTFLLLFRFDLDLLLYQVMNVRKHRKFMKNYKHALAKSLPKSKFVYFPLHLQPELTTVSWGGEFVDQILAIERLRAMLPDDWSIVVKENPKQTFHSRGPLFFARLGKIPGVFYVGKERDTFDLIEKAEFVSTVTGTAGLEALRFGKKALIFGDAPYKHFPGVVRYADGLTLDDVLSADFTHAEIESAYAELVRNTVDVVVSPDVFPVIENFSREKNAERLAGVINEATR